MTRKEFLLEMDDVLELPAGSLQGAERLEDLAQWNSTAMIGYIALADTNNQTRISPRQIVNCVMIDDLLSLARVDGSSG
jgi:hypothetical protein